MGVSENPELEALVRLVKALDVIGMTVFAARIRIVVVFALVVLLPRHNPYYLMFQG